jgi:predicted permease
MGWLSKRNRDRDLNREIQDHLELEAAEHRDSGLSAADANRAAQRVFGNPTYIKEATRETWGWTAADRLAQDVRYALRTLRHTPAFTIVAVLSLALGIGANTAIFSLLNALVLRRLPVPDPQQLVQFTFTLPVTAYNNWNSYFGYPQLERFRAENRTLSGVFGGVNLGRVNIGQGKSTGLALCDAYSGDFFSVLALAPQLGRFFTAADDSTLAPVAVISDRFWRGRFGADPTIVGQSITINELPFTVIGIAPAEFTDLSVGGARDLWIPLHALELLKPDPRRWTAPFDSWMMIAGRLRPGVSMARAQAELDVIHRRLLAEQGGSAEARGRQFIQKMVRESHLVLRSAETGIVNGLRDRYELPLKLLLYVAGFVLLISCANVANLVLARAGHRRREIALRMALGSGRVRVIRQLLTESLLIAGAGGALALAIAWSGGAALVRMISTGEAPIPLDIRPDWPVFGFTAAVSMASAILFGLAPAIRGTRVDPGVALKEGARGAGGGSRWLDRVLVAAQVTLSVALVAGAGLFARTLHNLRAVDVGYERENILMFSVDAKFAGFAKQRASAAYRAVLEKTAALPGVESASVSIVRPLDDVYYLIDRVGQIDGRTLPESEAIKVAWNSLSPGYFATIGTRIAQGRDFDFRDNGAGGRVVIVNESLARQALPGQNPIGHRLDGAEIIGVVKDALYNGVREQPRPVLYRPFFQPMAGTDAGSWSGPGAISFELRYRAGSALTDQVRAAVASINPNLPVFRVKTLRAQTDDSLLRERLLATLSSFFGALALLLACLGLYGLMAYAVARRTAEIGIRMALGAPRRRIVWLVLRETLGLVLAGVGAGVPLALWLAGFAKMLLFGVTGTDPLVLALSAAALAVAAALAAWLPARRATLVDPMAALRCE